MRRSWWLLGTLAVFGVGTGCTSLLGDFTETDSDDAGSPREAGRQDVADTGAFDAHLDAGDAADVMDVVDAGPDGTGCADPTHEQVLPGKMFGCPGSVYWENRNQLCNAPCSACSAKRWANTNGVVEPTHTYWTDNTLDYSGGPASCAVYLGTENSCSSFVADAGVDSGIVTSPMRVCMRPDAAASPSTDPEGNLCNWTNCGFDAAVPNLYFGGCSGNPTAGTLCCCP